MPGTRLTLSGGFAIKYYSERKKKATVDSGNYLDGSQRNSVKETSFQRLHTVSFHLNDIPKRSIMMKNRSVVDGGEGLGGRGFDFLKD